MDTNIKLTVTPLPPRHKTITRFNRERLFWPITFKWRFRLQIFGIDTDIDVVKHHGSTDPLILVAVLMHHGVTKEEVRLAFPSSNAPFFSPQSSTGQLLKAEFEL